MVHYLWWHFEFFWQHHHQALTPSQYTDTGNHHPGRLPRRLSRNNILYKPQCNCHLSMLTIEPHLVHSHVPSISNCLTSLSLRHTPRNRQFGEPTMNKYSYPVYSAEWTLAQLLSYLEIPQCGLLLWLNVHILFIYIYEPYNLIYWGTKATYILVNMNTRIPYELYTHIIK